MKTEIPEDFEITDGMRQWADLKTPEVDIDRETERFVDHWLSTGEKKASWVATWRNWIRRAPSMGGYMKSSRQRNTMVVVNPEQQKADADRAWQEMERLAGKPLRLVGR